MNLILIQFTTNYSINLIPLILMEYNRKSVKKKLLAVASCETLHKREVQTALFNTSH